MEFAFTTIYQQEHHPKTLRFELVFELGSPTFSPPCGIKEFLNDIEFHDPSHPFQQKRIFSIVIEKGFSGDHKVGIAADSKEEFVFLFIFLESSFFLGFRMID